MVEQLTLGQIKEMESVVNAKLKANVKMELEFIGRRVVEFHKEKDAYQRDIEIAKLNEAVKILAMVGVIKSAECNKFARYFIAIAK